MKLGKKLSVSDIEEYARSLANNPTFDPTFAEIVDLSEVNEAQLPPQRALVLADRFDPFSRQAKRAFIAITPLQMHCARMHQLLRVSNGQIAIVSSLEDAEAFLGLTPVPTTPKERPNPKLGT